VAGTITALKFQQRNPERVNVYLDGEYAFGLAAVEAARLRQGQVLSEAEIAALRTQDERQQAFDRAVRFLSYRPRSRAEVERYLRGKEITEDGIAGVIERLEQANYLDDEVFARFWVENREEFKPRSRRALHYELRQKGVSSQVIARALNESDDEAAAWRAVEGRLARWAGLPRNELRQKIANYLSRRGFDYEIITLIFEKACEMLNIEDRGID
jgi:regulatory protein